jgi:hypothetical protein
VYGSPSFLFYKIFCPFDTVILFRFCQLGKADVPAADPDCYSEKRDSLEENGIFFHSAFV